MRCLVVVSPVVLEMLQVLVFALVVISRLYITSHLARKRVSGFYLSTVASVVFVVILAAQELYTLIALQVVIMGLDVRGAVNNKKVENNCA